MITQLRVGIPIVGGKGWFGGISLIEMHVKAVASLPKNERPQLFLIATDDLLGNYEDYGPFIDKFDGIIYVGGNLCTAQTLINAPLVHCLSYDELFKLIDFYFPVCFNVMPDRPAVSWIPDFQHKYLPDFFSPQEIAARDEMCRRIAEQSRLVFCSSRTVEKDFRHFYPGSKAVTMVLSVRVSPVDEWYTGNPLEVQEKYGLPDRFILCANQFWIHKNHQRLFEAIALLRRAGEDVHLVCTGLPGDYRCPDYFQNILRYVDELGIADLVHILGLIPRTDQIQLIRRSLFVVQPSLFEGLSLIVQECRALGKTIILSDIDVLLEYESGIYFNRTDAQDLAQKISDLAAVSTPGPDTRRETEAKMQAAGLTATYAREFCKLARKAQELYADLHTKKIQAENPGQQTITIATTLSLTGDRTLQRNALNNWLQLGFSVVSFNTLEEISALQPLFSEIEFIPVTRTAMSKYRKPGVYLSDIFSYLSRHGSAVCGIIESDIYLYNDNFAAYIAKEAADCIIYGQRIDVQSLDIPEQPTLSGLGYLFFDRSIIARFPSEEFCLGLPWWDYWTVALASIQKIPVKRITTPLAYHTAHPAPCTTDDLLLFGNALTKYVQPSFALTPETFSTYQQVLLTALAARSRDIAIPEDTEKHDVYAEI